MLARLAPQVGPVAISANRSLEAYEALGHAVLTDASEERLGPLAGIHAGLRWARGQGISHVLSVAGDTPFIPDDLRARLEAELSDEVQIVMAALTGAPKPLQPTIALWPSALADDLGAALASGTRKIVLWAERHGLGQAGFSGQDNPFFNVNTPEDLAQAKARLKGLSA